MRATDIEHLARQKEDKRLKVFNPTNEDFTWKWHGKEYTIPQGKSVEYNYYQAKHMAKHLINKIMMDNSQSPRDEEKRKKWEEKILI